MKVIYIKWVGGTSTIALLNALKDFVSEDTKILSNLEYSQKESSITEAVSLVINFLGCSKVVSSAVDIDGEVDKNILEKLRDGRIKFTVERKCSYDLQATDFAVSTQGDFDDTEGKLLAVGLGEHSGVKVTCMLIELEDSLEKDIQYIIECNIDDMNSEGYDYIFNKLLNSGALDVYITPIIMKKGRPAVKLSVLCRKRDLYTVENTLFMETSTFGVRSYKVDKTMLYRSFDAIEVYGEKVKVKYGYMNGEVIKAKPEYEDCKAIAQKLGIGINTVYMETIKKIPGLKK